MKLYPHQIKALEQTKDRNRVAYYYDMGLGKTYIGSEKMIQLSSKVNLIVCQKSKINDWCEHIENNYKDVAVFNLTDKKEGLSPFLSISLDKQLLNSCQNSALIGIINYELAWRRKELKQLKDFTLLLDESSLIQNQKAKQSKFILSLTPKNVILLSGTPCSGKYENLYSQIKLLGWNISEKLYNSTYVNWIKLDNEGFVHFVVDKKNPYKRVDRLKDKLREHGAVFKKTEEVLQLPEQTFINIKVPVTKDYKSFKTNRIIEIEGNLLVGDTILKQRLYMKQLCTMYNPNRLTALKDLLSGTMSRVIVFYSYTGELERLKAIITDLGRPISEVNGHIKDLTAYETEDNSVTLVQYQAGAKGLNLQKANIIVYYSPTEKCEDWMQSQKRIHRIGQNNTCLYYKMYCPGSIEESIYSALERGVDYTDNLFKEDIK